MSDIDLDHLRAWVGKSHADEDVISSRHARLMAATVDHPDPERIRNGERLPPLWHRIYFLAGLPSAELGRDGHPARGGFLPPVPLPNRMWAGGRVSFVQPLLIGSAVRKESSILSVDHKRGRSGDLVFVTVLHQVKSLAGELLIREEHDIVYKGATSAPQQAENPASAHHGPPAKAFTPTSTTLFRYSALTCNGHRIHYDTDYCRAIEGYRSMVPAILGDSLGLHADSVRNLVSLSASLGNGATCMQAEARTA